ncbi:MAG: SusC/RagA family TonB-linked outer membrane protein [Tannerellaceae bacterium]|nr:SusC/RagA family TonB-linked outer membrane protein [Tannerellaceae bacterium]
MLLSGISVVWADNAFSQETRLSFRLSDISIRQAIDEIEKNSDYVFVWTDNIDSEANRKVSVHVNEAGLGQILDSMFAGTRLAYRVLADKQVVVYVADSAPRLPAKEETKVAPIRQQAKITVSGKVTTTTGEELIGVNIQVKGTSTGTITDVNGNYSIEVEPGNTLIYSYVSYVTQEIPAGNRRTINVQLVENSEIIEEVVVVGYGTQKKADLTSSISILNPSEVLKAPGGITDALQGNVAGINVSGGKIRIRGTSSITGNTDPLWVVDGIIDGSVPNDDEIESIQILKDAASAAIYGVRGANGVIVVTTKQGKLGQPRISFNSYLGTGSPAKKLNMLNAYEYAVYVNELYYNAATPQSKADGTWNLLVPAINAKPGEPMAQTDWWDEYFNPNFYQKYDLSVSGANENADYRLGATYTTDDNQLSRDNQTQNIYANIRGTRGRFTFGGRAQLSYSYNQTTSGASLARMLYLPPNEPVYDENNKDINGGFYLTGTSADGLDIPNQAWFVHNERSRAESINVISSVFGEVKLFEWLRYRLTYTQSFVKSNSTSFSPAHNLGNDEIQDYNYQSSSINGMNRKMTENLLYFDKTFGKQREHVLSGVAGVTSEIFHTDSKSLGGRSQEKNDFGVEDLFQDEAANGGSASDNSYFSYLARVMYTYAGKYMLTANFRADESSKFAKGNRWGYFPSFSIGWRLTEEPWMKETASWLVNLKLRATLGWIGSAGAVSNYAYQAAVNTVNRMYTFGPNQGTHNTAGSNVPAPLPEAIANRDLSWETTRDAGFGFDLTMLNNKLSFTFDYYNRLVSDMLLNVQLPSSVGAHPGFGTASVYMNVGTMTNWGLELSATYRDRIGRLGYTIAPNFSLYRNKVSGLGNMEYLAGGYVLSGAYVTRTTVGKPVAQYWGLKTDGLFKTDEEAANYVNSNGQRIQPAAAAGDIKYLDLDGNGSIGEGDKTFIGSSIPAASVGMNISLTYRGLDFSILWQGDLGISVFNNWKSTLLAGKVPQNQLNLMNNRFRAADISLTTSGGETIKLPANTNTHVPRAVLSDPNNNSNNASDFFIEDASYLRCNNITLGYTLPKSILSKYHLENLRLYAGTKNPFTITNYSMFDPQVPGSGNTLNRGVDGAVYYSTNAYLSPREYFAGIQLTF